MQRRIVRLACAVVLVGGAATARADPIAITGGVIRTDSVHGVEVTLMSDAFTLSLVGAGGTLMMPAMSDFFLGGQLLDVSATVDGAFAPHPFAPGDQTVALDLNLIANPVRTSVIGTRPSQFGPAVTLVGASTPFIMTGTVQGAAVTGNGALTVRGESVSRLNVFALTAAEFAFSSTPPAPTPEPTTLTLLSTVVVGAALRRFRATRRRPTRQ
jgi:hypothetical protein